jgi:hypothetical protein
MASSFKVLSTQPWDYLDATGRLVHGYRVFVHFQPYDEVHELLLPSIDPAQVKAAAERLLKQRSDLSTL